ncbi:MAG: 2-oxoglutarate dehydrogenase complex dihydrolipoyllysine-residue succinyltransferase [Rhodospirillaceae bacterium]|nr:2-oxoglutarate dehydrogenase complex dihydrolipoyllysine-residue succinyltransferase [Rhodospirillaceae bacterium]
MSVDIKVPALGESVTTAEVAKWFKRVGDDITEDEPVVELETDKVTLEVNAPVTGILSEILVDEGAEVEVNALLGRIDESATAAVTPSETAREPAFSAETTTELDPVPEPVAIQAPLSPAVRKMVEENDINPAAIRGTGKDGRLTKGDVKAFLDARAAAETRPAPRRSAPRAPDEREERVRMSSLRRRIAERLKDAQNTAAMLTTFNDVDMSALLKMRQRYRDNFEKRHGARLGFMSFFVKACLAALKEFPVVNAEIDGDDIVYKNFYHIGVAVGTEQGLVVPVLRDADELSFAEIERKISELGAKARDGALAMEDLAGGTFTISNGGVYGSMLSTPILNPPQSGILGMHRIEDRPVARDGQVVIRPMMYVALSYDNRIVDGREAVTFLVKVKEGLEDPERLLIGV